MENKLKSGDIVAAEDYGKLMPGDIVKDIQIGVVWDVVGMEDGHAKLGARKGRGNGPFIVADPDTTSLVFRVVSSLEVA